MDDGYPTQILGQLLAQRLIQAALWDCQSAFFIANHQ